VVLALIALIVPIDEALRIGPISWKISSTAFLFGRSFVLPAADAPLLALVFGVCALWFFGSEAVGLARRLVPLGLIITALLVASIAVQPFLFAALTTEMAVLVSVPLLSSPGQRPGRGIIRFLIYQTLGMPFILFAGWQLAGVEASPGDLALTLQSTALLALGFAFLLAVFPLFGWIPQLMEESSPFVVGFILWLLPTIVTIFGLSFLDHYGWLRNSEAVNSGLRLAGLLMLASGGLWAAFQRHFGRLMAYTTIAETGFILLAASLAATGGLELIFLFFVPRALSLTTWALSLSILGTQGAPLTFKSMQGLARRYPLASAGLILATLSTAGFPLLAGFPPRIALWELLSRESIGAAIWFLVGLLGLLTGAIRMLAVLVMGEEDSAWGVNETQIQRVMLAAGIVGLFVLGIFPQTLHPFLERLQLVFQHLGQ
jgi:formate hydrogenlyase subunit 3/multisubunit Na+/H+ antiporter MnhD subunit